jgi:hypothetical protein
MSFTSGQIITISLIGVATSVGVAAATIQAGRMKQSPTPVAESPASGENPLAITPANNRASRKPELAEANTRASKSQKSASQFETTSTIQSSQVAGVSQQKAGLAIITPPNSGCKISQAVVSDPNPPLNVRSKPQVSDSDVVGKLKNDTFVSVVQERDGWLRITDPVPGWIAKNRTESSCASVKQQINFLPGGDAAIVKGRIIGGGSHSYLIRATKGQTMTVKNRKQVFPSIFTPDGKLFAGDPNTQGTKTEWAGKMPVTGNYTFQLDSNFRGYEYEFSVRLQ